MNTTDYYLSQNLMTLEGLKSLQSYQNDALVSLSSGISDMTSEIENSLRLNNNDLVFELSHLNSEIQHSISKILSNQLHQHKEVIEELKSMSYLLQSPRQNESEELTKMGLHLLSINENEEAIKILNEALEINPMNYKPYLALAHYYYEKGDLLLAFQNSEKCSKRIEYMPKDTMLRAQPFQIMAKFYDREGRFKEAYDVLTEAISLITVQDTAVEKASLSYERAQYASKAMVPWFYISNMLYTSIKGNPLYFGIAALDSSFDNNKENLLSLLAEIKGNIEKEIEPILNEWEKTSKIQLCFCKLIHKCSDIFDKFNIKEEGWDSLGSKVPSALFTLSLKAYDTSRNQMELSQALDHFRENNTYLNLLEITSLLKNIKSINIEEVGEVFQYILDEIRKEIEIDKSSIEECKEKAEFHLGEYDRYKNSFGNILSWTKNAKNNNEKMNWHYKEYDYQLCLMKEYEGSLKCQESYYNLFSEIMYEYKSLIRL